MQIPTIAPLNTAAMEAARQRQDILTKPRGALGRLETLSIHLAGIYGEVTPDLPRKAVVVMAGDHGVTAQGVSAYPSEVTPQMVLNFLAGGAAINVLARHAGAHIVVVDMGVVGDLPDHPQLLKRSLGRGTNDFTQGPAMTRQQAEEALTTGIEIADDLAAQGYRAIATGDMGIGNTTASSALVAALTGKEVSLVTGRGTGVDDAGLSRKIAAIERALEVNQPDPKDPVDTLAKVGGFEIAGLAGVLLGAAAARCAVVIDGFISGAAALAAAAIAPAAREYLVASHQSVEPGHAIILEALCVEPLLRLDLRLGEGTGAALTMPLLDASLKVLREMATFSEAGVTDKD